MTRRRRRTWVAAVAASFLLAMGGLAACSLSARTGAQNPLSTYALPQGDRLSFEGRVLQRLDAGSYVYLEVERPSGEKVWVVTLSSSRGAVQGVAGVSVVAMGYAAHFDSKRLHRGFDDLYFAVVRPA